MNPYSIFLTALFISMVLVAVSVRLAPRLGLVDVPDARKVHVTVIPRVGGIGMVLGTAIAVLLWLDVERELLLWIGGVLIIAVFALWDDKVDLDYRMKFGGQFAAALLVVLPGGAVIDHLSLLDGQPLPSIVSIPLTVLFLLGMTNATNLSDGLDGLAAGLSILSLACIMVLAAMSETGPQLLLLALAIIGATLGFLRYNTHPALVFMGDTGSQFLGFSLGVLAIWLTQKTNTALVPELPLLILGLPVIDTITVMTQRILSGQSPFKPDKNHFHHKLLSLGFDHYESVLVIYVIQAFFVISAYLLRYEATWAVLAIYIGISLAVVASYPVARHAGWRLHVFRPGEVSALTQQIQKRQGLFSRLPYIVITPLIGAYLLTGGLVSDDLAGEVCYFGLAISLLSVLFRVLNLALANVLLRLTVYTCVILATYAINVEIQPDTWVYPDWSRYYFIVLAIAIGIGVRYAGREYFNVTPSDFLVMAILLAAAYLPIFKQMNYAKLAVESAILLYGVEFALRRNAKATYVLWGAAMAAFMVIAARVLVF